MHGSPVVEQIPAKRMIVTWNLTRSVDFPLHRVCPLCRQRR